MGARTGEQFLDRLRKTSRVVWLGNERVDDVTTHPELAGAARTLAGVFDRQHRHADECLIADPETGEPVSISHMIPRSDRGPEAPQPRPDPDLRGDGGDDGAHARLHERQVRLLRGPPRHLGGRGSGQRGGRPEPGPVPAAPDPRGPLAHPHDHPAHDRQGDGSPDRGEPGHAPQGRGDGDGHRGPRRAHPRDARALRRRDRRLPGPADPRRRHRVRPGLRHPGRYARA